MQLVFIHSYLLFFLVQHGTKQPVTYVPDICVCVCEIPSKCEWYELISAEIEKLGFSGRGFVEVPASDSSSWSFIVDYQTFLVFPPSNRLSLPRFQISRKRGSDIRLQFDRRKGRVYELVKWDYTIYRRSLTEIRLE